MPVLAPHPELALPTRRQAWMFALKTTVFRARRTWRETLGNKAARLARDARDHARRPRPRGIPHGAVPERDCGGVRVAGGQGAKPPRRQRRASTGCGSARRTTCSASGVTSDGPRVADVVSPPDCELREGCIVPSIGGGLCQLSNSAVRRRARRRVRDRRTPRALAPGAGVDGRGRPRCDGVLELRRPALPVRRSIAGWKSSLTRRELVVSLRATARRLPLKKQWACPACGLRQRHSFAAAWSCRKVESCETCERRDLLPASRTAGPRTDRRASRRGWWTAGGRNTTAICANTGRQRTGCFCRWTASGWRLRGISLGNGRASRRRGKLLGKRCCARGVRGGWRRKAQHGNGRCSDFDKCADGAFRRADCHTEALHLVVSQNTAAAPLARGGVGWTNVRRVDDPSADGGVASNPRPRRRNALAGEPHAGGFSRA